MKKHLKLKFYIIFTIFTLLFALFFAGNFFYNTALNATISKEKVSKQDKDGNFDKEYKENLTWLEGKYTEIKSSSVISKDIYAYEFVNPNSNGKWVIVVHGYTNHGKKMATFIRTFYEKGYNVLAPDLLAHGKSKNNFYTMGGFDSKDLANWTKIISKKYNNPDIYLFGVSMGAATVINSLDENLPNNVKGFIADSAYISLKKEFSYQLKKLYHLPAFPILNFASIVAKARANFFIEDIDATNALKNTKLKALILHGDKDTFVPVDNAYLIYDNLKSEKEIHIFKNRKHVQAYYLDKEEYWNKIFEFLK